MIKTCEELYNATVNPKINDITLKLLQEYYWIYLHPFTYQYEIVDKSGEEPVARTIELRFDKDSFCHLLGIESIIYFVKNYKERKRFKGEQGWENVKNGMITIQSLREKKTKKQFESRKDKYVFFYILPKLVDAPKGVLYDKTKVDGGTNIDCEILFYDEHQNAQIHLGIEYFEELGYYRPRTFFVERITKSKDGLKYVGDQQEIYITKIDKNSIEEI